MKKNIKLKAAMFGAGITNQALSKKTKINVAYISQALNGRLNLSDEEKGRIANTLGGEVNDLFGSEV